MKKKSINLVLKKSTIAKLNSNEQKNINGGGDSCAFSSQVPVNTIGGGGGWSMVSISGTFDNDTVYHPCTRES